MVYFDLLGYTFVAYAILSVILSYYFLRTKRILACKEICYGFSVTILSIFVGLVVCYLIATELDFNGKSMSWYNRTYFSVALYCFPTFTVASAFFYALLLVRTRNSPLSLALQTQARLNGVNIVWATASVVLTLMGYRSGYVLVFPVFITLIVNTIIGMTKLQNTSELFYLWSYADSIFFFHFISVFQ